MLIQGTSISVTYKKIEGIKKAYYNNEEILKNYFNEATVLPVPDDAPVEIPRIIIKTLHEHAQLNISPVAATFEIHYNAGFEKNWELCAQYIAERMEKVCRLDPTAFFIEQDGIRTAYHGFFSRLLFWRRGYGQSNPHMSN